MGWQIVRLDKDVIRCKAPLVNNINIHGTGFAGSIYALAMASAWTLVQFLLDHHQLENVLVAADASIKYLKPVKTDIECNAGIQHDVIADRIRKSLADGKNAHVNVSVEVATADSLAATVNIHFVVICK